VLVKREGFGELPLEFPVGRAVAFWLAVNLRYSALIAG